MNYIPWDTSYKSLGEKIRAYRRLFGLRQEDLACQLGVDPSTVRYLEKNKHKPGKRLSKEITAFFLLTERTIDV
jgi:transcriptional regulator with XRE-family HTH domain